MPGINLFNFDFFDKGLGKASANDGVLTDEEFKSAQNAGWTVWDGITKEEANLVEQINIDSPNAESEILDKTITNMEKSDSYKQYKRLYNELLVNKMAAYGIILKYSDDTNTLLISEDLKKNPYYTKALKEAQAEAKEQLGYYNYTFGLGNSQPATEITAGNIIPARNFPEAEENMLVNPSREAETHDEIEPSDTYVKPPKGEAIYKKHVYNPARETKGKKTSGKFDTKWLEQDEYGSKTYSDWIKNNDIIYDEELANSMITLAHEKANPKTKKGKKKYQEGCGIAFRESAHDSGLNEIHGESFGYQNGTQLANNPHFKEIPHNIVAAMTLSDLKNLPPASVTLYDGGYINGHNRGHIGILTGKIDQTTDIPLEYGGYCSNSKQNDGSIRMVLNRQATHLRIFVPVKIPEEALEQE